MRALPLALAVVLLAGAGLVAFALKASPPPATPQLSTMGPTHVVAVANGSFVVDREPLAWSKCVAYQPVPIGKSVRFGYRWMHEPDNYDRDWPALAALGANTLKISANAAASSSEMARFLDAAAAHHFYVILAIDGPNGKDAADPGVQDAFLARVEDAGRSYARFPALLAWELGNEVDFRYQGSNVSDWYALFARAAARMAVLDPDHPVLTANNPVTDPARFASVSDPGAIFGVNAYPVRPGDAEGVLRKIAKAAPQDPVFFTEFGADAIDSNASVEDQATQASIVVDAWRDLVDAREAGRLVLGGCVFEWLDQWWKSGAPSTHDITVDWHPYTKGVLPDDTYSEEWFGLLAQSSNGERTPRQAYYALANEWGGTATPR